MPALAPSDFLRPIAATREPTVPFRAPAHDESPSITGLGDSPPGDCIDCLANYSRRMASMALVGHQARFSYITANFGGDFTCHYHPRQVAAIKALIRPPIDQYKSLSSALLLPGVACGSAERGPNSHDRRNAAPFAPNSRYDTRDRPRFVFRSYPTEARPDRTKCLFGLLYGAASQCDSSLSLICRNFSTNPAMGTIAIAGSLSEILSSSRRSSNRPRCPAGQSHPPEALAQPPATC